MKKKEKTKEKTKGCEHLNKNCWLVKNLNYSPYSRCKCCNFKFRNCLFLHYQIISIFLISIILAAAFFIEGEISQLLIMSVFVLVIVYGCFFNKSTNNIIQSNFKERKSSNDLKELTEKLEEKVIEQTKEIRKSYEELKRIDNSKTEFISMASHQLRTPLTAIKGYLSLLVERTYGEINEKEEKVLGNIFKSNERLIKMVGEMLDISKIDLGKMELEKKKVQIDEMVGSVYQEMLIKAKDKKLKLIFNKPKVKIPKILIDELKIRQVVQNLIDNAIKYTEKGSIKLDIGKKEDSIIISVKDTGAGLNPKDKESVFNSFSRGSAGLDLFIEGTGLGLYIARKYMDLHNGKIWAESDGPGKGSTFFVKLLIK